MSRYEVGADLVVRIFTGDNDLLVMEQPHKPNGKKWASKTEAENWAKSVLAEAEAHAASIELITESTPEVVGEIVTDEV